MKNWTVTGDEISVKKPQNILDFVLHYMHDIFIFGHERAALQPLQSNVFKLQTKCCFLMCTNFFQIFILIGGASLTQHDFEIPFQFSFEVIQKVFHLELD